MAAKRSGTETQGPTVEERGRFICDGLIDVLRGMLEDEVQAAKDDAGGADDQPELRGGFDLEIDRARRFDGLFDDEFRRRFGTFVGMKPVDIDPSILIPPEWMRCMDVALCFLKFGWMICSCGRSFRDTAPLVWWLRNCLRGIEPVIPELPEDFGSRLERDAFGKLVRALAGAYQPAYNEQLVTVEFPDLIAEDLTAETGGGYDLDLDVEKWGALCERFLNAETLDLLLEPVAESAVDLAFPLNEPWDVCVCIWRCAMCLGCCLACAGLNADSWRRCCESFVRCVDDCTKPCGGEISGPTGCVEEQLGLPGVPAGRGAIPLLGSAGGLNFERYTLEWRYQGENDQDCAEDDAGWSQSGLTPAIGAIPVNSGLLGSFRPPAPDGYQIRLTVYSSDGEICARECTTLRPFLKRVSIKEVVGAPVEFPPGAQDPSADVVATNPADADDVVSIGGPIRLSGYAFVGQCDDPLIQSVRVKAAAGWIAPPVPGGVDSFHRLWGFDYTSDQAKVQALRVWNAEIPHGIIIEDNGDEVLEYKSFDSRTINGLLPAETLHECSGPDTSGKYTLLLEVEDTDGRKYYDTQRVWFDNKPIHVNSFRIQGVDECADLLLSNLIGDLANNCSVEWLAYPEAVVYDEYIERIDEHDRPNDNFDRYTLTIKKQTQEVWQVPITVANDGTERRGFPGAGALSNNCWGIAGDLQREILTALDLRAFDRVCYQQMDTALRPTDEAFTLERGTCCTYTFILTARDHTRSHSHQGGGLHNFSIDHSVKICNDLPAV